jgi:hypothetical protein
LLDPFANRRHGGQNDGPAFDRGWEFRYLLIVPDTRENDKKIERVKRGRSAKGGRPIRAAQFRGLFR